MSRRKTWKVTCSDLLSNTSAFNLPLLFSYWDQGEPATFLYYIESIETSLELKLDLSFIGLRKVYLLDALSIFA